MGTSGETFIGFVNLLFEQQHDVGILENVQGAEWDKMAYYIEGRLPRPPETTRSSLATTSRFSSLLYLEEPHEPSTNRPAAFLGLLPPLPGGAGARRAGVRQRGRPARSDRLGAEPHPEGGGAHRPLPPLEMARDGPR